MPIFECTSKLRAADSNIILNLTAKHCLESGDSDSTTAKKSRFPNVDILPASSIVFSFSAVLNRKRIPSAVLINSQLAQHFLQFIRSNADQLGLSIVSSLYDDNSCPKISVTTNRSRLSLHDSVPVRVVLRSIHLQYSVSSKETSDGDLHLFSTRLSLPCRSLVDNILKRFVTFHLVKRYPLVFGTQLDVETPFFPSIFRSILEMAKRSPNPAFRARFKQLIKSMKQQHQTAFIASSAALATYLDGSAEPDDAELPEISSETALCLSMEKLFCIGMKRPSFKTTAGLPMTQADTQDDDELSQGPLFWCIYSPAD
ncbi:hypothetical protein BT96DRAFT_986737 [Gymnopus androsaceus JB14]|uniref:Uncharacterized protein n=1 Tax=Gymnopus androsaceus JB14 TaxID=1447944 RepID=A0A6A4ICC9_9AGAR|nr:hypothetical protein BT96DRAFT_986737 [Gymnopus androsaceus JB14]